MMSPELCECRLWNRKEGESVNEHHPDCPRRADEPVCVGEPATEPAAKLGIFEIAKGTRQEVVDFLEAAAAVKDKAKQAAMMERAHDNEWVRRWAVAAMGIVDHAEMEWTLFASVCFDAAEAMLAEAKKREASRVKEPTT